MTHFQSISYFENRSNYSSKIKNCIK